MKEVEPDRSRSEILVWLIRLLVFGFGIVTIALAIAVHLTVRDLTATYTGRGINPFQAVFSGNPTQAVSIQEAISTAPPPQITPVPWNGKARVTILFMGLDYRDWVERSGSPRSDSMMLMTIDPITRQAGMLSIPRDLWVEIPGFGHNRINAAYAFGEGYRIPGGGPGLAIQTVEDVIGVPIDYYAVIDFQSFERMIDEIGGIDVLVRERVKISPIGRESRWLEAKPYHLDGPDALAYARVRKGAGDDFGRAQRQQQVALAILDRVVGFDMVPTLVKKAPALYEELAAGIRTNLSLQEMVSLGWMAVQTPKEAIQTGVIAPPKMVAFYTRPDGASVLRAVPDQIRILRDQIFVETSALMPLSLSDIEQIETP